MKNRNKLFSIGLLVMITSVLFVNGFIQIAVMNVNLGSTSGSSSPSPTFGTNDMNYTIIYGHPSDLTVTKSESVGIELFANGSIKTQRVSVNFIFENDAYEPCSFDLIDRAESCDLDTIKFQKGTFPALLKYDIIATDEDFGVMILKWSNISVNARSRAEYGYSIASYKSVPLYITTDYYVNGTRVDVDPIKNALNASIGSRITNIIRVRNMQQDLYSTSSALKPLALCIVTVMLPYESDEAKRDMDEPIFNPAPIMTNIIGPIQQLSWLALGDLYEINWTTTIRKGGGWGIIELQPIRFDLIQSADLTGLLFDGLSGLLGLVAAQQAYWAGLTVKSMIEEITGMVCVFQMLLGQIQVQLGMLQMVNYSVLSSLLMALIEIDLMRTELQTMYEDINATYYTDIINDYLGGDAVRSMFRTILGINEPPFWWEGTFSNDALGLGTPYASIPLLLDYLDEIERRVVASVGAQLIELLGSPAIINMTSTSNSLKVLINATLIRNPDNTTDFYTQISLVNLTLPLTVLGFPIFSLNLSRTYEFRLNNVPGDRLLFTAIDDYFGHPSILSGFFPADYQAPGSPGSNFPGFYTWVLDILQVGRSAIWWMIGNLTQSLATMMLLLDSSFSKETWDLINAILTGSPFDPSTPITLEGGFSGVSGLLGIVSAMQDQFKSPFGSSFSGLLPSTGSISIPVGGAEMGLLNNFEFWTALKLYLDPVLRVRHLFNITLPLNLGNITGGTDTGAMMGGFGFSKSAENGAMANWNWSAQGLSTVNVIQTNINEGSTDFKRFQLKATGNVNTGYILLTRDFDYTIPASQLIYRFRINNTNLDLSVRVISQNASGADVYAIQEHDLSGLTANTWYEFSANLESNAYWEYYDNSFDPENIKGVELRIIPHTTNPVRLELDYMNFSRQILPYPYDLTILDNYLIGDGAAIFPNITIREKWTAGLSISALKTADMTDDGIADIIAGSNDGYLYLLNGSTGAQIWNFSAKEGIKAIFLEDLSGDSTPEIIFGTGKGSFYILNKNKVALWNLSMGSTLDYFEYGNLTKSGKGAFIIGQGNSITAFNSTETLWNRTLKGTLRALAVEDLNGDGVEEIIAATSKYKIYMLNGTNGNIIWDYLTEDLPTLLKIGNFRDDLKKEILYSTDADYCVVLNGIQGTQLFNFTADATIWDICTTNITGDMYDEILLHTGQIIGHNLSAIQLGPTNINKLWTFSSVIGYSLLTSVDYFSNQKYDEILIAALDNRVYLLNSSGVVKLNFTISRSASEVAIADLTQEGNAEFIFGSASNQILALNGNNQQKYWNTELGEEIITFQFIRTSDKIQLRYNLPGTISNMLDLVGFSLTGTDSLANLANFDLSMGVSLGGLGGTGGLGGFDLSTLNISLANFPIKGIGLLNMLQFEITLIATLQDMKQVSATQRAFTGIHEVRYTEKDSIDYQLYPSITQGTNAKYIQYKIRNFEDRPIMVHSFALNLTLAGEPLPIERLSIEGWNGTHYVNLGDNSIDNITMAQLGLNYTNGKLIFKPYLQVEELEKPLLTIDWLGRELRVKVDTTSINPNDLSIVPWVDVSIELPGIEMPGVSSVISYSKTHPTFIVTATPTPNITPNVEPGSFIVLMLKSPVFWALSVTVLVAVLGFGYMQRHEQKGVKIVASKKIIKWLKKRETSWQTLVKANVMTESQFQELKRIRYRIKKENLGKTTIETSFDKVMKYKLISTLVSTVLLMRFWRGIDKPSRLLWILNNLEHMALDPLKHAWATFKTALGYLNPWNLDRARKREVLKKAEKRVFWKKIEPPRKLIRKKKVEIYATPPPAPIKTHSSSIKVEDLKEKPKSKWKGEYRNDGGTLLKKLNQAKRLPPIDSRDGIVFYALSKRKFVGITLGELSKSLEIPEYEVLVSLIRLFEKGLIFMLQEGKTLSEDLWDITSSLRKYDSELEKMIESIETLEDELTEGMEYLNTEIKNDKEENSENPETDTNSG